MTESPRTTPSTTSGSHDGRFRLAWWTLAFALICGGILRLVWIEDMEWKQDEQWAYVMSQAVGRTWPLPWTGMLSNLGFPIPGFSVWIFVAIGRIVHTPTSMARVVAMLNILALVGFAGAVRAYLPAREREPWIWGLALESVSPFAIRLSRKIWPPSTLTPFLLILWISHRHRQSRWGAFAWGLVGALIGQVHLSGWFVAAGLFIGTVAAERWGSLPRSHNWRWWLFGTVLGLTIALPWACALSRSTISSSAGPAGTVMRDRILGYPYALGVAASSVFPFHVLGLGLDTHEFDVGPLLDGKPTYFTVFLCIFVLLAFVTRLAARLLESIVAPGARLAWRTIARRDGRHANADQPPSLRGLAHADRECTITAFTLWSTIAIPSVIYVVAVDVYFFHYYFVFCPFLFVLVAVWMLPWRRVLLSMVVAQALLSYCFLSFIHHKGGTNRGEYGQTYARQGNR
jgi:hypothetical protein